MTTRTLIITLGALLLHACAGAPGTEVGLSTAAGAVVKSAKDALNPLLDALPIAPDAQVYEGTVAKLIAAGGYWYCAIDSLDEGTRWVATMGDPEIGVGDAVRVVGYARARNFHSARTGRVFDELAFGLVTAETENVSDEEQ